MKNFQWKGTSDASEYLAPNSHNFLEKVSSVGTVSMLIKFFMPLLQARVFNSK